MEKLDRLPVIKRSEVKSVHRCPACGVHLRRLGHIDPKQPGTEANRIIEMGYACQNHKCDRTVLSKYDRDGIAAFEVHSDPHPLAVKRAQTLMAQYRLKTEEPIKPTPIKPKVIEVDDFKTPEPGGGDEV